MFPKILCWLENRQDYDTVMDFNKLYSCIAPLTELGQVKGSSLRADGVQAALINLVAQKNSRTAECGHIEIFETMCSCNICQCPSSDPCKGQVREIVPEADPPTEQHSAEQAWLP
ncbi:hypothetical protein cyc_02515 [Cyclospora cayetanensis]|uniref:Uncharacterized protein n=1 Tax=Cyclospora cayetanensis TaxID=88456 RepID=A0A1D3DAW5_9EIME|nr:hypothetical protein cyc_02515 [Cyclospora cayetanensis]